MDDTAYNEISRLTLRLPEDLQRRLKESAKRDRRSINSEAIMALDEWLTGRELAQSDASNA